MIISASHFVALSFMQKLAWWTRKSVRFLGVYRLHTPVSLLIFFSMFFFFGDVVASLAFFHLIELWHEREGRRRERKTQTETRGREKRGEGGMKSKIPLAKVEKKKKKKAKKEENSIEKCSGNHGFVFQEADRGLMKQSQHTLITLITQTQS